MAKIWRVYDGREPTTGGPWIVLPVSEAVDAFELRDRDYVSDLKSTPRFGDIESDLARYGGFKHIVVEINEVEGKQENMKAGFYRSRIRPADALNRLLLQALTTELDKRHILRLETEPTIGSDGREALRVCVLISPDATNKLKDAAILRALVKLHQRLNEMKDDRTPIIEYATEEELARDGGSQS